MFIKDKEFWEDFVCLYKQYTCLWDVNSKDYLNKAMKQSAYEDLITKCKEVYVNANKDFVCKRIANMRTSFRREYKKVQNSKRTGSGTDEIYKPSMSYYDLTMSLAEDELGRNGTSTEEDTEEEESSEVRQNFCIH